MKYSKLLFYAFFSFFLLSCQAYNIGIGDSDSQVYRQYEINDRSIGYMAAGNKNMPKVVFLHGAPGSSEAFGHFLQDSSLAEEAYLIAVDRPGYGQSGYGHSVVSLKEQAQLLKPLISRSKKPVILVGHSLGGPLAVRMAMDFPDLVDALILIAPAIDPQLEPSEGWFRLPLSATFLRWLLPPAWRTANDELYFLEEELNKMLPLWKNIEVPVTIIHGKQDEHVASENARFAREMLVNSPDIDIIIKDDLDHFVPWQAPDLIKNTINKYLLQLQSGDTEE